MAEATAPTTLVEFASRFTTEEACAEFLFKIRWPEGFVYPRCGTTRGYQVSGRRTVECAGPSCRYQCSVTAETVMHGTKQDRRTWFWAAYLVSTLTAGISTVPFQREMGIARYETAFNILHKLRAALVAPGRDPRTDEVEVDEAYVGGEEEGRPGTGTASESLVACAVELRRWRTKAGKMRVRTGRAPLRVVSDASAESLVPFVVDSIAKAAIVLTDGWPSYPSLRKEGFDHRPVAQDSGENAKYLPHVHGIISNLKTWLMGTHHGRVERQPLQAYLNAYTFRFNRRFWRGPAFLRALGLAVTPADRPNYEALDAAGDTGGWLHPYSHANGPAPRSSPTGKSGPGAPESTG
jgi:transposase-like protein